jgi:hypothetical protein
MAGYLFALDSLDSLELYAVNGVYGTKIRRPGPYWGAAHLFTLGDYLTMRPGDLVFFFIDRKIYGVGRLIAPGPDFPSTVALCNYPDSFLPTSTPGPQLLWDQGDGEDRPWVCFFEPSPAFSKDGLDMDDVLDADVKSVAQGLRVFERRSFVQMDDDEADLLSDLFVRSLTATPPPLLFPDNHQQLHQAVQGQNLAAHQVSVDQLLGFYVQADGKVRSEAALEVWLVDRLNNSAATVSQIFGSVDYVTHQLPASPTKPVIYLDRIDVLGWQTQPSPGSRGKTVTRYKVIEVKKDAAVGGGAIQTVNQLLKYVDWLAVRKGGYGLIDAYLIASDFDDSVINYVQEFAIRDYVSQRRPFVAKRWHQVTLVSYDGRLLPTPLSAAYRGN